MKKLFVSFLFALTLISSSTVSFAKSPTKATVVNAPMLSEPNVFVEPDALKLNVAVDKELGANVYIKIIDQYGKVILNHQLDSSKSNTFTRLDVSALDNGDYKLEISAGKTKQEQKFEIKTPGFDQSYRGILLKVA